MSLCLQINYYFVTGFFQSLPGVVAVAERPDAVVVLVHAGHAVAGVAHGAVAAPVRVQHGGAVGPLELEVLVQVLEADPVPLRLLICNASENGRALGNHFYLLGIQQRNLG